MAIGVTLAAIGIGLQAYGIWKQGQAAKKSSNYNARMLRAAILQEEIRSEIIADRIRANKRRMEGIQTARYMKAGVLLEGTPLEVLADTAAQYEEDVAINDYNKRLAIAKLRMGIEAERIKAEEAMTVAILGMGGTILGAGAAGRGAGAPTRTTYDYYGYWGSGGKSSYYGSPY